jgi:hypothetical protein
MSRQGTSSTLSLDALRQDRPRSTSPATSSWAGPSPPTARTSSFDRAPPRERQDRLDGSRKARRYAYHYRVITY